MVQVIQKIQKIDFRYTIQKIDFRYNFSVPVVKINERKLVNESVFNNVLGHETLLKMNFLKTLVQFFKKFDNRYRIAIMQNTSEWLPLHYK